MEYVVYTVLSGGVVLLGIAIIVLVRSNASVAPTLVSYGKQLVDSIKNQVVVENERDEWKTRAVTAEAEIELAKKQIARLSQELADGLQKKGEKDVEAVRTAPNPSAALDKLNELLQDVPDLHRDGTAGKTSP